MHYVITCIDKPDHGHVRAHNRPAHLAHLKAQGTRLLAAGLTTSDDGETVTGGVTPLSAGRRPA